MVSGIVLPHSINEAEQQKWVKIAWPSAREAADG